jgi:hypothetical protein
MDVAVLSLCVGAIPLDNSQQHVRQLNGVIAAELFCMRRKVNTLKVVANRSPDGIMCESTNGQQISHVALRGLRQIKIMDD